MSRMVRPNQPSGRLKGSSALFSPWQPSCYVGKRETVGSGEASMALERELAFFNAHREEFLKHYRGKFVVIVGDEVVGTFDTADFAYRVGLTLKGNIPMLIKKVEARDFVEVLPVMVFGLAVARP